MLFEADNSDSSGGEEQNEPSSQQVEKLLSNFRTEWQEELKSAGKTLQDTTSQNKQDQENESKAKLLFNQGVEMEKSGQLYEAIQFYRRAVQLVPDIEFRASKARPHQRGRENENSSNTPVGGTIDSSKKHYSSSHNSLIRNDSPNKHTSSSHDQDSNVTGRSDDSFDQLIRSIGSINSSKDSISSSNESDNSDDEICPEDLYAYFQKKMLRMQTICITNWPQKTTHISELPTEMILYILRWVISSDLDLRSLEMFSMVCRGFYLCARAPELWKSACARTWGQNSLDLPAKWPSWRQMFIERSRVCFNGCYIGKTTYIRAGENSFQDQLYRPWHLVTYNRYIRFFPEGVAIVLTSSDEPAQCVTYLRSRNAKNVLRGFYWLKDDYVTVVVQRQDRYGKTRQRTKSVMQESAEQTFRMELEIKSLRNKRHAQLVWKRYCVYTKSARGDESTNDFDLVTNRFPPFQFSRVKSYTSESEYPLD